MERRSFLKSLSLTSLIVGLPARAWAAQAQSMKTVEDLQKNWKTLLADGADIATSTTPLKRTNAEWKKTLAPASYNVLREEGTERPGSSPLDSEKRPGVFGSSFIWNRPAFSIARRTMRARSSPGSTATGSSRGSAAVSPRKFSLS